MTPSVLVLVSLALGLAAGAVATTAVFSARAAGKRRAAELRPELPETAVELLNPLDQFAVILDASLTPVYANPTARDNQRINGAQLQDPEFLQRARKVMSSGIPDTVSPDPLVHKDAVRMQIIRVQYRFLAIFVSDISEEQRVNAMRRDFIANVSHELKTPIAAIGLLSEAVLEAADEPEFVRNFSKKLIKESRRLGDLSRDIILLSEAQSSLQPEDREIISLRAILRSEVEAHLSYSSQRGVELALTDNEKVDPLTVGRPSAVGTVIANLLSNAIRHSPEGGRVGIGMSTQGQRCIVTITDQGDGIEAEHLPRIFERFYRVDASRSRADGGTGLGLSIARHTMRALGGDIDVWSQPGVGSTFTLSFPLLDSTQKTAKKRKKIERLAPQQVAASKKKEKAKKQ